MSEKKYTTHAKLRDLIHCDQSAMHLVLADLYRIPLKKIAFEVRKYMHPFILRDEIRGSYLSRETGEPSRTPRTSRHYNMISKSKREDFTPK